MFQYDSNYDVSDGCGNDRDDDDDDGDDVTDVVYCSRLTSANESYKRIGGRLFKFGSKYRYRYVVCCIDDAN